MSPAPEPPFPPRSERDYAAAAVEIFPWPIVAGYDDVHHWMDEGQAVHAEEKTVIQFRAWPEYNGS